MGKVKALLMEMEEDALICLLKSGQRSGVMMNLYIWSQDSMGRR